MVDVAGRAECSTSARTTTWGWPATPTIVAAAHAALDRWGFGMASVRFICGTQALHRDLERRLSEFLGADDTILYSSCFDANGGLFEALLGPEDAVISDAAQPRLDHRRHPALQGAAAALREQGHGRAGGAAARSPPARGTG